VRGRRLEAGAVTVIQRFGSDLRLNVHLHSIFVDGIFTRRPGLPARLHSRAADPPARDGTWAG